ncbi:hypothetical protein ACJROX_16690 [Pseudalkalibacillus sp. A8]|uniref:hypothetical protein n=1 Tax=Pseudalkalibacillus sp. A8 TaxID=3382641 RepID=UPI0038B6AEDA
MVRKLDVTAPYEVFAAAGMYSGGRITVEFVSAEGRCSVPSGMNEPALEAQATLDPNSSVIILVPGAAGKPAGNSEDAIPNILRQAKETGLTNIMKQAFSNRKSLWVQYVEVHCC